MFNGDKLITYTFGEHHFVEDAISTSCKLPKVSFRDTEYHPLIYTTCKRKKKMEQKSVLSFFKIGTWFFLKDYLQKVL